MSVKPYKKDDGRSEQKITEALEGSESGGKINFADASEYGPMLEAEAKIRDKAIEHGLLYTDIANNPDMAMTGDSGSVGVPTLAMRQGQSLTHNHPDAIHGGTFSPADISIAARTGLRTVRAAGAEGTYYLRFDGPDARPMKFRRRLAMDLPTLERRMDRVGNQIRKQAERGQITPDQAAKMYRTRTVGIMHRYYKNVAPDYGLVYGLMKTNKSRR